MTESIRDSQLQPPSIWVGRFTCAADWHRAATARDQVAALLDGIDDRMLVSRHPFSIRGHCVVCDAVTEMAMAWHLGSIDPHGSVNPAWTLNACCVGCGLVSRQRALIDFLLTHGLTAGRTFVAEAMTEQSRRLLSVFDDVIGSEYLGPEHEPGASVEVDGTDIRHEDVSKLSFTDETLDLVVTQDVFEHVPDIDRAFREARRVLRAGGRLVFTIPCFAHLDATRELARVRADGSVDQLVEPPELHGDPVHGASLCLRHFGWDLLDLLRSAGFRSAAAHAYWGPWGGHLGGPNFVYEAVA